MAMMLGSQHVATNATFTILICITQENKPNSPVQEDPMELYHIYIYIYDNNVLESENFPTLFIGNAQKSQ